MALFGFLSRTRVRPRDVAYDIHNHLLPGVDDGVEDLDEASECILTMQALGYSGAAVTPHIFPEAFDNDEAKLRERFELFHQAIKKEVPGFSLQLGAEYYYDDYLLDRMRNEPDRILTFGVDRQLLLIEFGGIEEPRRLDEFFRACAKRGIRPIIAHVERYGFLVRDDPIATLGDWREQGALIQVNLGALSGHYGASMRDVLKRYWRAGVVDIIGSDLHGRRHLPLIQRAWKELGKLPGDFDATAQRNLINPGKV